MITSSIPWAVQGSTHMSPALTWTKGLENDALPLDLTGATITATLYHLTSGTLRAVTGTFSIDEVVPEGSSSPAQLGQFTWAYSSDDTAVPGDYLITLKATYGEGDQEYTMVQRWTVTGAVTL